MSLEAGIEGIYREHGNRIWRALLAYSGDPEIASDATAEAFAQALSRGDDLRSPERWIWKAAFRIAAGQLKSSRREVALVQAGSYELNGQDRELTDALKKLPTKQRGALVLFYYADRPIKEIARTLRSTGPAVRVHLSQGRKRLREMLEARHE